MKVVGVPAEYLTPQIVEKFEAFTDRGHMPVERLIADIVNKERQCWAIIAGNELRAVVLTRVAQANNTICEITHVTGEGLQEWHVAFEEIEKWARSIGCVRIKATARPGYERIGKQYCLRKTHVLLEKDL